MPNLLQSEQPDSGIIIKDLKFTEPTLLVCHHSEKHLKKMVNFALTETKKTGVKEMLIVHNLLMMMIILSKKKLNVLLMRLIGMVRGSNQ